jgi:hypothetical protein
MRLPWIPKARKWQESSIDLRTIQEEKSGSIFQSIDWNGTARNELVEQVNLQCKVIWEAGTLRLTVSSDETSRNFLFYCVIEEQVASGDATIHTALPVLFINQEAYVPQEYLDSFLRASRTPFRLEPNPWG